MERVAKTHCHEALCFHPDVANSPNWERRGEIPDAGKAGRVEGSKPLGNLKFPYAKTFFSPR